MPEALVLAKSELETKGSRQMRLAGIARLLNIEKGLARISINGIDIALEQTVKFVRTGMAKMTMKAAQQLNSCEAARDVRVPQYECVAK